LHDSSPVASKFADGAVVLGWLGFFLSHIDQINKVMQFFGLCFAIAASWAAYRYHTRKHK
jgi:hypothetical protein